MRRSLSLTALFGLLVALLAAPVASASTTAPAIDPADNTPYAGAGTAELLSVEADIPLATLSVADLGVSPVATAVDTAATPRSTATAANLNEALLGAIPLTGILAEATQSAPPDNDAPVENTILEVPAAPLVDLGVSTSRASARWPGDGVCLAPGESIADGYSETAGAEVLAVDGVATVATVNTSGGVTYTQNAISTAEVPGETGRALVSNSTTQVDSVTVLQGTPLEVTVGIASTPTLTATATGQPGGASVVYSNPVVTIDAPDGGLFEPLEEVGGVLDGLIKDTILGDVIDGLEPILGPISDAGVLDIEILVGEETLQTNTAADGTAATGAASVVQINISVLDAGGTLLDVSVDVGPMTASVAVPAGGINCEPDLPECSDGIDNDGEGTIDIDDPNCHTDGDPDNPDSYDPDDDDESSECNDGIDNEDPEDTLADAADPGCHTDGDANNPDSYDPNGASETDQGQPRAETPAGPLPRTGGDVPLAAAMAFGGLGLAAIHLMRRRITA